MGPFPMPIHQGGMMISQAKSGLEWQKFEEPCSWMLHSKGLELGSRGPLKYEAAGGGGLSPMSAMGFLLSAPRRSHGSLGRCGLRGLPQEMPLKE